VRALDARANSIPFPDPTQSVMPANALTPAGLLALQRAAGNAATTNLIMGARDAVVRRGALERGSSPARDGVVQRVGDFTVTDLAVAGATPVTGAADTFVAPKGAVVTGTATVVSASGAALPPRTVRWSSGRAGSSQLERILPGRPGRVQLKAKIGASSRTVTIFIADAAAPPGALPVTAKQHKKIGTSNPGVNFGLTVVTIGDQGVKSPTFEVKPFFAGDQWSFAVTKIKHGFKIGVKSQGRRDVPNAASVSPKKAGTIITDLTPPPAGTPSGPPRTRFWVRSFTVGHEEAHRDHFYLPAHAFWDANMDTFAAAVAGATVTFDPAIARKSSQVIKAQKPGWKTAIDAQHNAADAAEIATAETFAHGVSNPHYTTLVNAIRATVKPPAPTGLTATASGPTSVDLGWAQDAAIVTSFVLERRTGSGPWAVVAPAIPAASLAHTDGGLTANTKYTYRISAQGAAGGSSTRTVKVRTPP
jgi:hypothetical protein